MLMRKLLAALGPVLLCLLTCQLFRLLDKWFAAGSFFLYALKGMGLGACVALVLPTAGISTKNIGLTWLLFVGAGVLLVTLLYQYLETVHVVDWPALVAILSINGQVVLIESTVMAFMAITAGLNAHRKPAA